MDKISELTIDWNRCIHIDSEINEELLSRLIPEILALRQASNDPITIAINSVGGSLATMESIISLVKGPDQDNKSRRIITVAVHRAYSAAATLLAMGDYAVALNQSDILFHDVRYGGLVDVTPEKAKNAARQLQSANEGFSLRLANHVFERLIWNYIDLSSEIQSTVKEWPEKAQHYKNVVAACGIGETPSSLFDVAGFVTLLFSRISRKNEELIENAMTHLARWGMIKSIAKTIPTLREDNKPGMLDEALNLYNAFNQTEEGDAPFGKEGNAESIKIALMLVIARLATEKNQFENSLESAISDFAILKSIDHPRHMRTAERLMRENQYIFFSASARSILNGKDEEGKKRILSEVQPVVALAWHFCVLLCRELFNGEHHLTPRDAQFLGLIDEIPGAGLIKSRRDFRLNNMPAQEKPVIIRKVRRKSTR